MWTLELVGWLPMNLNTRDRSHWSKRKKELRRIIAEFGWQMQQHRIPTASGRRKAHVVVVKGSTSRARDDRDNLHARAKGVLDALVFLRLLQDDNEAGVAFTIEEASERQQQPRVLVELEDIDR